ncbi:MAG TPA: hypothetical protein VHZ74_07605 [Bryobacteraceae bacterium]|nr:hypothetical protein [Bryobacteraceae bacterium]
MARPVGGSNRKTGKKDTVQTRQSRGLEQFFFNIRDVVGLSVLDCAGANQDNIDFLINLGHKVYSQDLVRNLDDAFGRDPTEQTNPSRIDYFLKQNFEYPSEALDGVLLWDSLQFMSPPLLNATVERLYDVMRPKSYLLAFFTATERVTEVPSHTFRIADSKTIVLAERDMRAAGQVFNNRNLEKLFGKFESVKFFLTRESLREVIVRR